MTHPSELSRPRVPISAVTTGTILRNDGFFACIPKRATRTVQYAPDGLFLRCKEGRHYLDGQIDGDDYIGFILVE